MKEDEFTVDEMDDIAHAIFEGETKGDNWKLIKINKKEGDINDKQMSRM